MLNEVLHRSMVLHLLLAYKGVNMTRYAIDDMFSQLESLSLGFAPVFRDIHRNSQSYPPHNIIALSDADFLIEVAVAGFKRSEIKIQEDQGLLTISGEKETSTEINYRHRGIASRAFTKSFKIAEHYEISSARLEDGILSIQFTKVVPEETKSRYIEIK